MGDLGLISVNEVVLQRVKLEGKVGESHLESEAYPDCGLLLDRVGIEKPWGKLLDLEELNPRY
jgi:hypothetical protein